MIITKFPQSCLSVETGGVRLLFDPGVLKYQESFFEVWNESDAVFITHKHSDHCDPAVISEFSKDIPVYASKEVTDAHSMLAHAKRIKEGDVVSLGGVSVTAVKAIHGYHPKMKGNEIHENIGYLVNDGSITLYITSDTICFPCDIKADVLAVPVTGHGVTMTAFEASLFALEVGAKHIILTHMDNQAFEVDLPYISKHFKNSGLEYIILDIGAVYAIS